MERANINFLIVKNSKRKVQVSFNRISRLSVLNSEVIKNYLLDIVNKPHTRLEVNLAGITFIDSTAFDILNLVSRIARKNESVVVLTEVGQEAMELIELVKKYSVFDIHNIQPLKKQKKVA